jgi:hypothetical protein
MRRIRRRRIRRSTAPRNAATRHGQGMQRISLRGGTRRLTTGTSATLSASCLVGAAAVGCIRHIRHRRRIRHKTLRRRGQRYVGAGKRCIRHVTHVTYVTLRRLHTLHTLRTLRTAEPRLVEAVAVVSAVHTCTLHTSRTLSRCVMFVTHLG